MKKNFVNVGKQKKRKSNGALSVYCGNKECHPLYGIKRPEHSEKMKHLAKDGSEKFRNNLIKKGEIRNPLINTPGFCEKFIGECSSFGEYSSKILNGRKCRTTRIMTGFNKWDSFYVELFLKITNLNSVSREILDNLSEEDFNTVFLRFHRYLHFSE